ncbi:sensor histidine kinase, partial [Thermosynechococcus sp.]|uniref:sensor histidine kinase n=1 Tax=Thermosynechococcus sp. TaxID=2814275 RepID=UPI00391CFFB7
MKCTTSNSIYAFLFTISPKARASGVHQCDPRQEEQPHERAFFRFLEQLAIQVAIAPTFLATLVNDILADLQPLLQKNKASVKLALSPTLPLVLVDPIQLRRVYENLITNALKHNPPGIIITLTAEAQADSIYCTVQDNGMGIRPNQRSRLFDLYYRGSESHDRTGIGLGLYLGRQIITAHGSEIGVKAGDSQGAAFWFRLPLANPA